MTERLADIVERIDNMHQLGAVVTAMRGIAATRAQQGRGLIAGIETYAETISHAIGQVLHFLPSPAAAAAAPGAQRGLIMFCSEQGFAGAFTDRILDAAQAVIGDQMPSIKILLVGSRGAAIASERGFAPVWTTGMANQIGNVPEAANRIADALYARIARQEFTQVDLLSSRVDENRALRVDHCRLLPLDFETFRAAASALPPITTLDAEFLLARLAEEYIYAKLCEAAMHSFAAENEARMQAMRSASENIDKMLQELTQREHHVRQEEITAEIVELSASVEAQTR